MSFHPGSADGSIAFWLASQQRKVESEALGNIARVRSAKNLADVVRLARVTVPHELRAIRNSIAGLRSLNHAIEEQLIALVQLRVKDIASSASAAEALAKRGKLMVECSVLRGDFSQQYRLADASSQREVFRLQQSEKATLPLPTPPESKQSIS